MGLLEIFKNSFELNEELENQRGERRKRKLDYIFGSGIKPVCKNCKHMIKVNGREDIFSCERRRGIIPLEIADNLTCVRNCDASGYADFKPKERVDNEYD